ncbi:MAG: NAD(+) diphosphatase [Rhodobacteraceae bacterium]|nr:NAD(+) diphosphatase [Paracoccaceae bacterium]
MRHAEAVTFGGSGLDRAAELRTNTKRLAELQAAGEAIALWHGKPLFDFETSALIRLKSNHPLLQEATEPPHFLGLNGNTGLLVYDVSPWQDPNADAEAMAQFFDPSQNRYPGFSEAQVFSELRGIMAKLSPQDAELAATARSLFEWHENHPFCSKCGAPSEVAQSGWQRTCPACGAFHFPRTDPVVIVLATHGNSVLLGRSPNWPEGMYSLLAGFMEPGETMEAAARREVFEESGIRLGDVRYLSSQPWPFPSSLMIGCFADALNTDITLDPNEIEDARWFTREELVAASVDEKSALKPARKGSIAHFLINNWLADTLV